MPELTSLTLENNQLYGQIPEGWGQAGGFLSKLEYLSLSENG